MKKLFVILLSFSTWLSVLAGGLVTNTNQSAMFTRFQCRDATLDIDAVYYNPAGLVHLGEGFYLSINNQVMGQLKMITTTYDRMSEDAKEYEGKVTNPLFPGIYGAYKLGRFAFSAGVNPISGDGITNFNGGLPSYEIDLADKTNVVRQLASDGDLGIALTEGTDPGLSNFEYDDAKIDIKSRYLSLGYQVNVSFQINDYLSIATGARLVNSTNYTRGSVSNLVWKHTSTTDVESKVNPVDYLLTVAGEVANRDTTTNSATTNADLVDASGTVGEWANYRIDVTRTGIGFTPIISINYAPSLMTNWSFKYEFKTSLDLLTSVIDGKDGNGRFIDGGVEIADIPAMLSIGLTRRPSNRFMFYTGIHYYFDKAIDFDGSKLDDIEMINKNTYEFALGGEYIINNKYRASAGISMSRPGVNASYLNEERFAGNSNTIGGGFGIRLSPLIDLNLGGSYTMYKEREQESLYNPEDGVNGPALVSNIYDSRGWVISVGLDFLFGENN